MGSTDPRANEGVSRGSGFLLGHSKRAGDHVRIEASDMGTATTIKQLLSHRVAQHQGDNPVRMLSLVLVLLVLVLSGASELMACQAMSSRTVLEKLNDDSITTAVRGKLAADNVKNMNMMAFAQVEVRTERETVILSGVVQTSEHKVRAEQLAGEVAGVKSITNNLQVETNKQR